MAIQIKKIKNKSVINSLVILFIIATSMVDVHFIKFSSNQMNYLVHLFIWLVFLWIIKYLVTQNNLLNKFEETVIISKLAMEQSPNILLLTNLAGEVIFVNQRLLSFSGLTEDQVKGKNLREILPNIKPADFNDLAKAIKSGKDWQGNLHGHKAVNEPYWLRITLLPIRKDYEENSCFIIADDITEQKITQIALQESEQNYYSLFHDSPVVKLLYDPADGSIVDANKAAVAFYGYPKEKLLTMKITAINALGEEEIFKNMEAAANLEQNYFTVSHILANGGIRTVEVYCTKVNFTNRPLLQSIILDITERNDAEMALRNNEEKYRALFENANDAIFLYEVEDDGTPCKYIEVNNIACNRLGYSKEKLLTMTPLDLCKKDQGEVTLAKLKKIIKNGHIKFERIHVTKDGRNVPVEINAINFELNGKNVNLAIARDVTDRKIAEEFLRKSNKKYSDLFNNSPAVKMLIDPTNGKIVDVNQAALDFYGYSKDKFLRMNITDINMLPTDTILKNLQETYSSKAFQTYNFQHRIANGDIRDVEVYSGRVETNNRSLLNSIVIDVTDRKRAELALKISEEKYRTLFENANDAIFFFEVPNDPSKFGNFIEVNTVACKGLGYTREELLSMSVKDIDAGSVEDIMNNFGILDNKKHITFVRTHITKDKRKILVEINSHQFELNGKKVNLAIARDITERRRTEKLALLGELSTGVAHEIKNPLAIIRGYTEYLQSEDDLTIDSKESLQYIINTVDRLDKVVNNFLRFSQPVDAKLVPTDMTEIINEAVNFISPTANRQNVHIEAEFMSRMPVWYLDKDSIMQVLLNLLLNSLEMMNSGKILIKVFYDKTDKLNKIIFSDNGPGIPKSSQSKIFEPFFTTKKAGSGLGLSIVANLVRNMFGTIEVESDEGVGTTFTLSFPVIDSAIR